MTASGIGSDNPYVIGRPIFEPELFFGREELFQFIATNLNAGARVIWLYGQRRIGKSSVLRQIPRFVQPDRYAFVRFDLQDKASTPLGNVLAKLAEEIVASQPSLRGSDQIRRAAALAGEPEYFSNSFLPAVYASLGDKGLVLLLDEFDALNDLRGMTSAVDLFRYFLSVIARPGRLQLVPVIGRHMDEVPALLSLHTSAPTHEIGLLLEPSARLAITKPVDGVLEYQEDALQAILNLTAGHPYFTQVLCFSIFERARTEGVATISRHQVDDAVAQALEYGQAGLAWFYTGLPIAERVVYAAVAEVPEIASALASAGRGDDGSTSSRANLSLPLRLDGPGRTNGTLERYLEQRGIVPTDSLRSAELRLLQWGFLRKSSRLAIDPLMQLYSYEVTVELVRRWLVSRYALRRVLAELETVDPASQASFAAAANARDRDDVAEAARLYEQTLKANPNYFAALFALAELRLQAHATGPAVELYSRAFQVDPARTHRDYARALLGYGRDLLNQGQLELAREQLRKVQEIEPGNAEVVATLTEVEDGVRRALATRNPFVIGRPVSPNEFVGRERALQTIFSQIGKGGHVAVFGEQSMGKSSLLRFVSSPETWHRYGLDSGRATIVRVDCAGFAPFTPARFWRAVLEEYQGQVGDDVGFSEIIGDMLTRPEVLGRDVLRLLQQLTRRDRSMTLLVDEFDVALQSDATYSEAAILAFVAELRSLAIYADGGLLSMVVASRRRLSDLGPTPSPVGSPLYNIYLFLRLELFTPQESQALIAKMPQAFNPEKSEVDWVNVTAGGHPYLLQVALFQLYQWHAEGRPFEIEAATSEVIDVFALLFENLWSSSTDLERELIFLLAIAGSPRSDETLDRIRAEVVSILFRREREMRDLQSRGLITERDPSSPFRYALFSPLFTWWVVQTVQKPTLEPTPEAGIWNQSMSRSGMKRIQDFIQQIQQRKPSSERFGDWLGLPERV